MAGGWSTSQQLLLLLLLPLLGILHLFCCSQPVHRPISEWLIINGCAVAGVVGEAVGWSLPQVLRQARSLLK